MDAFKDFCYEGKVVFVHQASLLDIVVDLGFGVTYRPRIQLRNVKVPDINSSSGDDFLLARAAKEWTMAVLLNKDVFVHSIERYATTQKWVGSVYMPKYFLGDELSDIPESVIERNIVEFSQYACVDFSGLLEELHQYKFNPSYMES